jgi:DNA-binding response OmpR family regulator
VSQDWFSSQVNPPQPDTGTALPRELRLLLVGGPAVLTRQLDEWSQAQPGIELRRAETLEQARAAIKHQSPDLALIEPDLPDGSGLTLAEELARGKELTLTIMLAGAPTAEQTLAAMRAGISDVLDPNVDTQTLDQRLRAVLDRPRRDRIQAQRAERLHRLCQRLHSAREEVSQQVDTLCSDLVQAYHELAGQLDAAMHGTEFSAVLDNELDLETLLRRTLEFLVRKVGRTHGVVYLPCSADEFSVGGFVGQSSEDGPPEVVLEDLADRLVPAMAQQQEVIELRDEATLQQWLDDAPGPLEGFDVIGVPCQHEGETLAVIVLFRDRVESFPADAGDVARAVGPRLGEALERMIRIHHRHMPEAEYEGDPDVDDNA